MNNYMNTNLKNSLIKNIEVLNKYCIESLLSIFCNKTNFNIYNLLLEINKNYIITNNKYLIEGENLNFIYECSNYFDQSKSSEIYYDELYLYKTFIYMYFIFPEIDTNKKIDYVILKLNINSEHNIDLNIYNLNLKLKRDFKTINFIINTTKIHFNHQRIGHFIVNYFLKPNEKLKQNIIEYCKKNPNYFRNYDLFLNKIKESLYISNYFLNSFNNDIRNLIIDNFNKFNSIQQKKLISFIIYIKDSKNTTDFQYILNEKNKYTIEMDFKSNIYKLLLFLFFVVLFDFLFNQYKEHVFLEKDKDKIFDILKEKYPDYFYNEIINCKNETFYLYNFLDKHPNISKIPLNEIIYEFLNETI